MPASYQLYSPPYTEVVWAGAVGADFFPAGSDPSGQQNPCRRIIIGKGGLLVVTDLHGTVSTLPKMPDGFVLDGQYTKITAAGSAAYDLILQW
jgi:hypothetical protein